MRGKREVLDVELCLPHFNHVNTSIADMQLSHYDYMVNVIKLRNITLIFCQSMRQLLHLF